MKLYIVVSYFVGIMVFGLFLSYAKDEIEYFENRPCTMLAIVIISLLLSPVSVPIFIVGLIVMLIRGAIKENKSNDE